jgi:hypothetical protein
MKTSNLNQGTNCTETTGRGVFLAGHGEGRCVLQCSMMVVRYVSLMAMGMKTS